MTDRTRSSSRTRSTCSCSWRARLFVLTILGYLVSPYVVQEQAAAASRRPGSLALADWFDRNGPLALAVEFVVDARRRASWRWRPTAGSRRAGRSADR